LPTGLTSFSWWTLPPVCFLSSPAMTIA
jgi:hypothetical protein